MIGIEDARRKAARLARGRCCKLNGKVYRYGGEWVFDTIDRSGRIVERNLPDILVDMETGAVREVYLPSDEGFRILDEKTPIEGCLDIDGGR